MPTKKPTEQKSIFTFEMVVLERCQELLRQADGKQHDFTGDYQELATSYEKLLKLAMKVFKISDVQGRFLKSQEATIKMLLDSSNQGFLIFGEDLKVKPQYSAECEQIFGKKIAKQKITSLLAGADDNLAESLSWLLNKIFSCNSEGERQQYLQKLPERLTINNKEIKVESRFIEQHDAQEINLLLLVLTDLTEQIASDAKITYLSRYDGLTGVFNRTYMSNYLEEIDLAELYPISLILADINGLKLANDVFGHEQGDRLLANTARVLKESCRAGDLIARWGGDEFLLILPKTLVHECRAVVNRINVLAVEAAGDPIDISLAIGIATIANKQQDFSAAFRAAEREMYHHKMLTRKEDRQKMLGGVQRTLEARRLEPAGHGRRITNMALAFAKSLGIFQHAAELNKLGILAALHDIGKVAILEEILLKPTALTEEEWQIVQTHSEIGCRMAHSIGEGIVAEAILYMHERWDGTGYPEGLTGEEIPLLSRIMAMIDAFDIMVNGGVYKKAVPVEAALAEIRRESGRQFDPNLAAAFLDWHEKNKI